MTLIQGVDYISCVVYDDRETMIPHLTREGRLPPGLHETTLEEVRRRFGSGNPIRERLMKGLSAVVSRARRAGAKRLYLDGSFVTDKKDPGDWDAALLVPVGFNSASLDAAALVDRERIRKDHGGDLFVIFEDDAEILDYYVGQVFARERSGSEKGLLVIRLNVKEESDGTHQE
ncbi:MAG: DUF6932 family protein [Thermoanaerobaculia bacterium]